MRSVKQAFSKSDALRNMYIYTTDLPLQANTRAGLVPTWLNTSQLSLNGNTIIPLFPWNTFGSSAHNDEKDANKWRSGALPAFQSHAVESQMAFIDGISDTWLCKCSLFDCFASAYTLQTSATISSS
jgi:hypothetical protein